MSLLLVGGGLLLLLILDPTVSSHSRTWMTFKCKKCGTTFEDKQHYEIHKSVHKHARSRIYQYGTDMPWRPGL
jgi:hypothetical protein